MDNDIDTFTASQLTLARANDFVRFCALLKRFAGDPNAYHLAVRNFPVFHPRSLHKELFTKTAVAAGTTLDATWASPLSPLRLLVEAFLALLRPRTLIGRIPGIRAVPFNVSVPAQTAGGTFGWIGQGAPAPVTKPDFASVTLAGAKAGGIVVLTEELVEHSSPLAVAVTREEMINGCQQFLDGQFIDPAVAAVANVSPASITNGAGNSASAGTSQANANTDWQSLTTNFFASNPSVENVVALMTPANAVALSRALNQPTLTIKGGTAHGIPVITSGTVGARLIMLDASQILVADDGGLEVDMSNDALVQMDSSPADPTVASTVLISLFQANLVGLRITRFINWKRAQTTAVRYISGAAYV
jgi:hypothetical protein